jgi:hypothetical protein
MACGVCGQPVLPLVDELMCHLLHFKDSFMQHVLTFTAVVLPLFVAGVDLAAYPGAL